MQGFVLYLCMQLEVMHKHVRRKVDAIVLLGLVCTRLLYVLHPILKPTLGTFIVLV